MCHDYNPASDTFSKQHSVDKAKEKTDPIKSSDTNG